MEKSSIEEYIGDAVYSINARYTRMQSRTKVIYFQCLNENRPPEYFKEKVSKIWENVDHSFMDKQINELKELIHNNNVEIAINIGRVDNNQIVGLKDGELIINDEYFKLVPEKEFNKLENKFLDRVVKNYEGSFKSIKGQDKDLYIENKLKVYDEEVNQIVAYYKKDTNQIARYVNMSTYLSMLHNVDLTRSGWNTTIADAEYLDANMFIIPPHPFSCEHCRLYQNRPLSKAEVENIIGVEAREQVGNILHPNCKCELSIYWDPIQIEKVKLTEQQQNEIYEVRQKVLNHTLNLTRYKTDRELIKKYGTGSQLDKINKRIKLTNEKIAELVNSLPNGELKRQVKAINR